MDRMGVKKFGPHEYTRLINYWLKMDKDDDLAECRKTQLQDSCMHMSRLRCDYDYLTSYSTIIAARRINKYKEEIFMSTRYKYSVTTKKQVRILSSEAYMQNKKLISIEPFDYNFTDKYNIEKEIRMSLHLLINLIKDFNNAKSINRKKNIEKLFNTKKDDVVTLINFFRDIRNTRIWDAKLAKNISIDSDIDNTKKYIDKKISKEKRKLAIKSFLEKANNISIDGSSIITENMTNIDILSFSIAAGLLPSSELIREQISCSIGYFGKITKYKEEFYKVNNTIIAKDKVNSIIEKYFVETSQ